MCSLSQVLLSLESKPDRALCVRDGDWSPAVHWGEGLGGGQVPACVTVFWVCCSPSPVRQRVAALARAPGRILWPRMRDGSLSRSKPPPPSACTLLFSCLDPFCIKASKQQGSTGREGALHFAA